MVARNDEDFGAGREVEVPGDAGRRRRSAARGLAGTHLGDEVALDGRVAAGVDDLRRGGVAWLALGSAYDITTFVCGESFFNIFNV